MNYSETEHFYQNEFHICLVRKNMDVNGHERLLSFTNRHKFKQMNIAFIPVQHFSHIRVFNNEQNSYTKMSETCLSLQSSGTLDLRHIWASFSLFASILGVCNLISQTPRGYQQENKTRVVQSYKYRHHLLLKRFIW
jgi:hypothetical protein